MLAGIAPLSADWRDEIGYTRLQLLAGTELPTAPSQGFTQAEGLELNVNYAPDTANPLFTGKTFSNKSGASGSSSHATRVATNFYGNSTSLITGNCPVHLYSADGWLQSNFLNWGTNSLPLVESRAVENHSWVGGTITDAQATEINRRLDFAINRDGFMCVVGMSNEAAAPLPKLLGQSYHTISVGRDDGRHSAGFTTLDSINVDDSKRIKPDIVAPSAAPEDATSWTTPMVSSAAGLLYSKLVAAPYSLTGADKPRVIKALLLATAIKIPSWANTSSRPLDLRYGSGILNINHAYNALRAGRAAASNSIPVNPRGWGAETVSGASSKSYFFTLAPGAPSTPFSAALTWHRVVAKSGLNTWTATLANLNLRLFHADGFTRGALIAESLSSVDNVELVYQSALAPGTYALVVENTSSTATPYAVAWHSLPAVTIAATVVTAREIDLQAGLITVSRTGATTLPLLVPLAVSGSASAGSHYLTLPPSVTIQAGQSSATLQVTPVADSLGQGNRSVIIAVAADFALVHDPTQTAAVTIQDKPFDAWRFANFTAPELGDPAVSAENADPDGDALPNFIEYALSLDPRAPSLSTITTSQSGGYQTLTAAKNTDATDILWNADVTADLINWQSAVTTTDSASTFIARDSILAANSAKRFIVLKITRP